MSLRVNLLVLFLASGVAHVNAQTCTFDWKLGDGFSTILGDVYDVVNWDPDGPGPQTEMLVAGGAFSMAGDAHANSVAAWDGTKWHALGEGVMGVVYALGVYGNDLIVGGDIYMAGGQYINNIARWDGTAWHAMDKGLGAANSSNQVRSLESFNGELFAGGTFYPTPEQDLLYFARWNGTQWTTVGGGVDGAVIALTVLQGKLVVGGGFTSAGGIPANSLAIWDGSSWSSFDQGLAANMPGTQYSSVYKLVQFRDALYASGWFRTKVGTAELVVQWNGTTWTGTGLSGGINDLANELVVFQNRLIAGGDIWLQSSLTTPYLVAYDGLNWQSVVPTVTEALDDRATALGVYHEKLIVGGENDFADHFDGRGVVAWDGTSWGDAPRGLSDEVNTLFVWRNKVIAGGVFFFDDSPFARVIAEFAGRNWLSVDNSVRVVSHNNTGAKAMTQLGDHLIVGGSFFLETDGGASGVARWDGTAWHRMGSDNHTSVEALGSYMGALIATGDLNPSTGPDRIAIWDGQSWNEFGGDINGTGNVLHEHGGDLFIGGFFSMAGTTFVQNIARWTGQQWDNMAGGLDGRVVSLASFEGNLIAGGHFAGPPGTSARFIASWDGFQWHPLGVGVEYAVEALAVYNGVLFAQGPQNSLVQSPPRVLAAWDGEAWQPMGDALDGTMKSMVVKGRDLWVGGTFFKAGARIARYVARWGPSVELGDYNANQLIELSDYQQFPDCLSGPASRDASAIAAMDCLCVYNSDADADIDLADFAAFQRELEPRITVAVPSN